MSESQEKTIPDLRILYDNDSTIFEKNNYMIPLYQRAFAWGNEEIRQLIEDINGCEPNVSHYYLGSLIVKEKNEVLEVIDGQQRLTALYLLLNYLGKNLPKQSLTYECRDNSNFTLAHLSELLDEEKSELHTNNSEQIEDSLLNGWQYIKETMRNKEINGGEFIEKLKKVIIYKIEVPKNTDLNRYFEIMNVRGEQLEQYDILKAELMYKLQTAQEREQFAIIWDACSDMNGYVQMHFGTQNRNLLFGYYWDVVPQFEWRGNKLNINDNADFVKPIISILRAPIDKAILNGDVGKKTAEKDRIDENENRARFKSIMGFSHFLLHVLNVFVVKENFDNAAKLLAQLDDIKLLQSFRAVMYKGKVDGKIMDKDTFSKKFLTCLLKCRFLFDKYVIKREYKNNAREDENNDDGGVWSLQELWASTGRTPDYKITRLKKGIEWTTVASVAKENMMLQSCLRVSSLSQKAMHWVTKLLTWLYDANYDDLTELKSLTENIVKEDVKKFLVKKNFKRGVQTPHIVFNYLDYLLWEKRNDNDYKKLNFVDFTFGFRNSVEHWYPQHPSSDSFASWVEKDEKTNCPMRDRFGNLCIVSRVANSKFSNKSPIAKQKDHEQQIKNGSLKLRLMSDMTDSNVDWRNEEVCGRHEKEMIELLRTACDVDISQIWDDQSVTMSSIKK